MFMNVNQTDDKSMCALKNNADTRKHVGAAIDFWRNEEPYLNIIETTYVSI